MLLILLLLAEASSPSFTGFRCPERRPRGWMVCAVFAAAATIAGDFIGVASAALDVAANAANSGEA